VPFLLASIAALSQLRFGICLVAKFPLLSDLNKPTDAAGDCRAKPDSSDHNEHKAVLGLDREDRCPALQRESFWLEQNRKRGRFTAKNRVERTEAVEEHAELVGGERLGVVKVEEQPETLTLLFSD